MNAKNRLRIAALILVGGLLPVAASGCGRATSAPTHTAAPSAAPTVQTARPERGLLKRMVEEPGQIEGYEQTSVFAKIAGYVEELHADIGDPVTQGQLLAVLSVPELQEQLRQKEAAEALAGEQVEQAKRAQATAEASLVRAEVQVRLAETGLVKADASFTRWQAENERMKQLLTTRSIDQTTADATLDQFKSAESALAEIKAAIESAKAAHDESGAKLEQAKVDVRVAEATRRVAQADRKQTAALWAYREIRAPFNGTVTRRGVDRGAFLQPSVSGTAGGTPLFVVVRSDTVRVFIDVPEAEATAVKPGAVATVRVPALQEQEFTGRVSRSSVALDPQSRTLRTQIDVPNADGRLRVGLYVSARITSERDGALTVPAAAVFVQDDQPMVVRVEAGKAVRTPVKLGVRQGDRVELLKKQVRVTPRGEPIDWKSLTGDEELIAANPASVTDGQAVSVAGARPGMDLVADSRGRPGNGR
jgi:RND family efflux transporter MFP subunit